MSVAAGNKTALLAIVGDVMLGRLVTREIGRRPPEAFWGNTLPVLQAADAVIINLECAISDRGSEWTRTPKVFHFRAKSAAIEVLQAVGVRYASLANNHVLDYGEDALRDTLAALDAAGIAHAGAGANLDEARQAARFDAGGVSISAFSITDNEPPFAATATRPGTCYVDPRDASEPWPTARAIETERDRGADIVLISAHLGPNMVLRPLAYLRSLKQRLLANGADIIHGHSAHVFQGIEAVGNKLILHDTGDFLNDYAVDEIMRNDWSFIFVIEVDGHGVRRVVLRPVVLGFAEVHLAEGALFEAICERMGELSREFGLDLDSTGDGLEVTIPAVVD
jgi:poly-gamma-glutamate synthesis protein (capsule biosynthesis protein)